MFFIIADLLGICCRFHQGYILPSVCYDNMKNVRATNFVTSNTPAIYLRKPGRKWFPNAMKDRTKRSREKSRSSENIGKLLPNEKISKVALILSGCSRRIPSRKRKRKLEGFSLMENILKIQLECKTKYSRLI